MPDFPVSQESRTLSVNFLYSDGDKGTDRLTDASPESRGNTEAESGRSETDQIVDSSGLFWSDRADGMVLAQAAGRRYAVGKVWDRMTGRETSTPEGRGR